MSKREHHTRYLDLDVRYQRLLKRLATWHHSRFVGRKRGHELAHTEEQWFAEVDSELRALEEVTEDF